MSPSSATVSPARRLRGRLRVPGDKSIAHRYAILAALADGRSTISNYAPDGRPPMTIHGAELHAIAHRPETPSAQVKSAVLLAGLHAQGTTIVQEPAPTRDHTERALTAFGGRVDVDERGIAVAGGQKL